MNEMLKAMSTDMNIKRFRGETDVSFKYRLIFSALGQWCLRSACSPITKHSQTILLNDLLKKYIDLFPEISTAFELSNGVPVTVFIRRVYEEIGYLFTDRKYRNKNKIAKFGKGIEIEIGSLFFGVYEPLSVVGLGGIISQKVPCPIGWKEALIRDNLTWKQYLNKQYDIVLFEERDIAENELEFFNPKSLSRPSSSWEKQMKTDMTVARKTPNGPFYKVMRFNDRLLYCEMPQNDNSYELNSYEYRRLLFALKKDCGTPLRAKFTKIDDEYSEMEIGGHLPNREYYLLLLCSWPDQRLCNKNKFIVKNCMISLVKEVLNNLAIEIKGE